MQDEVYWTRKFAASIAADLLRLADTSVGQDTDYVSAIRHGMVTDYGELPFAGRLVV